MAKRTLRGSIEDLPALGEQLPESRTYSIVELALITYRAYPGTVYQKQELGGVVGRTPDCEGIYVAADIYLMDGSQVAFPTTALGDAGLKKLKVGDIESYEILTPTIFGFQDLSK